MADFHYIDSVNITVARKIVNYAFGATNVIRVTKNDIDWTFDIWLVPDADINKDVLKYFNEYWGNRYVIHKSVAEK